MRARDAGLLALKDSLAALLPGAPSGCSIGQVLRHTAELGNYITNPAYLHAVQHDPDSPLGNGKRSWQQAPESHPAASNTATPDFGIWVQCLKNSPGCRDPHICTEKSLNLPICVKLEIRNLRRPCPHRLFNVVYRPGRGRIFDARRSLAFRAVHVWRSECVGPTVLRRSNQRIFTTVLAAAPAPSVHPAYGVGVVIDRRLGFWCQGWSGPEYCGSVFSVLDSSLCAAIICSTMEPFSPEKMLMDWLVTDKQQSASST